MRTGRKREERVSEKKGKGHQVPRRVIFMRSPPTHLFIQSTKPWNEEEQEDARSQNPEDPVCAPFCH